MVAEGTTDRVDDIVHCLTLGPTKKAQFYGSAIQKRRHFRIVERDIERKTTFDSGILAYFDVGRGERTPFYGVLTNIICLWYGKYGQTLFRGMWYDNKGTRSKGSTTVLTDECGITRVKAIPMPYQEKVTFDPFVMLEWAIQVFYIIDKLHTGWQLMHEVEAWSQPVIYKFPDDRRPETSQTAFNVGELEEEGSVEVNEIDSKNEDVRDEHGDEGNSDEEHVEDFVERSREVVRRLIGTNYLLTEAELTVDLDSDEEFVELN